MPLVEFAWGSQSISRTFFSITARDAAKFMAVVVFPTPPFWLAMAIILVISVLAVLIVSRETGTVLAYLGMERMIKFGDVKMTLKE